MTPERMAQLVARWVRLYTRKLPPAIAERRIDEVDADLHDHNTHERAAGTAERRIALGLAARMLRGLAADLSWRGKIMKTNKSILRVALVTACLLFVPLIATLTSDGEGCRVGDFVLAAVLIAGTGFLLEMAVARPRVVAYRAAVVAIGVAAILFGGSDDAPGLVLFGLVLIAAMVALSLRTAMRRE
jgi:hypothetical protein